MLFASGVATFAQKPEMKYLQSGKAVVNASLVFNEKWTDKDSGEAKEKAFWYKGTWWGRAAEVINQYFDKGDAIQIIKAEVTSDVYMSKKGEPRSNVILTVKEWSFVPGRKSTNGEAAGESENDPLKDFAPELGGEVKEGAFDPNGAKVEF